MSFFNNDVGVLGVWWFYRPASHFSSLRLSTLSYRKDPIIGNMKNPLQDKDVNQILQCNKVRLFIEVDFAWQFKPWKVLCTGHSLRVLVAKISKLQCTCSHHEASKSCFSVRETGYTSAFAGYQHGLYHLLFSNSSVGSFTLALSGSDPTNSTSNIWTETRSKIMAGLSTGVPGVVCVTEWIY